VIDCLNPNDCLSAHQRQITIRVGAPGALRKPWLPPAWQDNCLLDAYRSHDDRGLDPSPHRGILRPVASVAAEEARDMDVLSILEQRVPDLNGQAPSAAFRPVDRPINELIGLAEGVLAEGDAR